MTTPGQCRLCFQNGILQDSHIWPRFAYKDYVSDRNRGGQFVDLAELEVSNTQDQRPWFCWDCEQTIGKAETQVAELVRKVGKAPTQFHAYDFQFARFCASVSLRFVMRHVEDNPSARRLGAETKDACRHWREFLLGKRRDLRPFSQHAFVFDHPMGFERSLTGNVILAGPLIGPQGVPVAQVSTSLTLTQIGPLLVVGLLGRSGMEAGDRRVWDASRVLPEGAITRTNTWLVGQTYTEDLRRVLHHSEVWAESRVRLLVNAKPP